jgi:DNA polymerase-1
VSRLLIVDGHAYAYRAFHAIRDLRGPQGRPTNAIYGFIKMLEKMRGALEPAYGVVVWDGGLSAERLTIHPDYKQQRPEMPADLRLQLDEITGYLGGVGMASYCAQGIEADDYIGCLARRAAGAGWNVVIASSDKDFMQLVSPAIGLWNPNDKSAGQIWTREHVVAKTGVEPAQVAEWLALMGDAVDNIPGVSGVGPKTATDLVRQFGTVAALLARLGEVKSEKLRTALRESEAVLGRNLQLVRLQEVACEFVPEQLAIRPANREQLRELFRRWGFKGMLESLDRTVSGQQAELI